MIDPNTIVAAGIPVLGGWIWWVDRKVSSHEAVIQKMDRLLDILLQERLQDGRFTPSPRR
jgi:hypothetical protein